MLVSSFHSSPSPSQIGLDAHRATFLVENHTFVFVSCTSAVYQYPILLGSYLSGERLGRSSLDDPNDGRLGFGHQGWMCKLDRGQMRVFNVWKSLFRAPKGCKHCTCTVNWINIESGLWRRSRFLSYILRQGGAAVVGLALFALVTCIKAIDPSGIFPTDAVARRVGRNFEVGIPPAGYPMTVVFIGDVLERCVSRFFRLTWASISFNIGNVHWIAAIHVMIAVQAVVFSDGNLEMNNCDFSRCSATPLVHGAEDQTIIRNTIMGDTNCESACHQVGRPPLRDSKLPVINYFLVDSVTHVWNQVQHSNTGCRGGALHRVSSPHQLWDRVSLSASRFTPASWGPLGDPLGAKPLFGSIFHFVVKDILQYTVCQVGLISKLRKLRDA